MAELKVLVTIRNEADKQALAGLNCRILAEYPDCILVCVGDAQRNALLNAGIEINEIERPRLSVGGASFSFESAVEAEAKSPLVTAPAQTSYYLLRLVGPAKGEWLATIQNQGIAIHGNLPGYCLLVGGLPSRVQALKDEPWVETVTPYRPGMKISPKLQRRARTELGTEELAALVTNVDAVASNEQVQISVFAGENKTTVRARISAEGGRVLSESERSVTAILPTLAIAKLAEEQCVRAIMPHEFPELHNDRAAPIMGVPEDHTFGETILTGANQIIAVADSGLDSGDPTAIHQDFAGRVEDIVSWPTDFDPGLAPYLNDPVSNDDGTADRNSGHGTHVAGSVLGNGASALAAGSTTVPRGIAPGARLFFQSVEQRVHWKSVAELVNAGLLVPPKWPPREIGLYGLPDSLENLFQQAYDNGARIHTNSWGAPNDGIYNESARGVDEFMWHHRDMLILFSAGNAGKDVDINGNIDADSIGTPGTAKNCLTVGASENDRPQGSTPAPGLDASWSALVNPATGMPRYPALGAAGHVSDNVEGMAAFSSRGPTDDGRIKPDFVAPGTNILSTRSSAFVETPEHPQPGWGDLASGHPLHGLYNWSGGTSMSTPLVAGAAALIRQHLVEQREHFVDGSRPSGALVKAFLVHGAQPMEGQFNDEIPEGPNPVSGFGRVNLLDSISPLSLDRTHFLDDVEMNVETLQTRSFQVEVADHTIPLRVTLVWTDAPSQVGLGGGGLVNKLYLQVLRPDGTLAEGDVTPFPIATNNVQRVIIRAPTEGVYHIRVRGIEVMLQSPGAVPGDNPRQDFALVVSNALALGS